MGETLTAEEVAGLLKVTEATVYRWVREGTLPAQRLGRTLRFRGEDIESVMNQDSPLTNHTTVQDLTSAAAAFAEALVAEIVKQLKA